MEVCGAWRGPLLTVVARQGIGLPVVVVWQAEDLARSLRILLLAVLLWKCPLHVSSCVTVGGVIASSCVAV